jgi:4-amino-4-deoxy-L-arabinose transferase-like glycosyltransferase
MAKEIQSGNHSRTLGLLVPVALAAIVYLASTASRPVIDYDEGHYSQVAVHMVTHGDWVTPYANGIRFLEKPPLLYWMTAASFEIFGINEFALRLPTALAVIALVMTITLIGRRTWGDRTGLVAGLCTAFSAGTFLFTIETLHDIWLVLFITVAMYAFHEWYLEPENSLRRALLFYVSVAGAVMSKSLVGLAFPLGIVVVFYLLSREWPRWRSMHILPGSALVLALTVPWHWLAAMRNPGFLWDFFVNEQFLRFLNRHDPPVLWSLPLLTFWALIPVWFFPWTAFLPAAFAAGRRVNGRQQHALVVLVMAWVGVILGFFSISGRLEHYAFPVLPALSLMVGLALSSEEATKAVRWGFRALAIFGGAVLTAATAAGIWYFAAGHSLGSAGAIRTGIVYETDFSILADMPANIVAGLLKPAAVTIFALPIGFLAALWFERRRRRMHAITSVVLVMMVVCGMIRWSLGICEDYISSQKFALAVASEAQAGDHLVVVGDYESANSMNFYEPLKVEVVDGVAYALIPGMKYPDAPKVVLSREEFEKLWNSHERVFVLVPKDRLGELKPEGTTMLEVLDRVLIRNHRNLKSSVD